MSASGGLLRGSVRWAFNFRAWEPSEQEWILASRCIQVEEKERIGKFVFKVDGKASMAGRLLMRKFAHLATGVPYEELEISRDKDGRPYLKGSNTALDFNVSHQGNFTVLAGEIGNDLIVGADVMNFERKTGHQLSEFFRIMRRTFSDEEWNTILNSHVDEKRISSFFRHWCLKESYLKATGLGIRIDLRRITFKLHTPLLSTQKPCVDSVVTVDGTENLLWKFHEWLLDDSHCVAVALSSRARVVPDVEPKPFTVLSWSQLIEEAKPILPPDVLYCQDFMQKEETSKVEIVL